MQIEVPEVHVYDLLISYTSLRSAVDTAPPINWWMFLKASQASAAYVLCFVLCNTGCLEVIYMEA